MGGFFAFCVLLIAALLSSSEVAAHPSSLFNSLQGRDDVKKPLLGISKFSLDLCVDYEVLWALRIDLLTHRDSATRCLDHPRLGRRHYSEPTGRLSEAFT
jgi:hypothetical protein